MEKTTTPYVRPTTVSRHDAVGRESARAIEIPPRNAPHVMIRTV
jgi:hypothetical protein